MQHIFRQIKNRQFLADGKKKGVDNMISIPHFGDGLNLNYLALLACVVAHHNKDGSKKCLRVDEAVRIITNKGARTK